MRSLTLFHIPRHGFRASRPAISLAIRKSSTQSILHERLTARSPNIIYDYLSPTPSHLLNVSLADFLPESCYPPGFSTADLSLPLATNSPDTSSHHILLPQGHHLVYFSPQVPSSALLPDGTDPLQSPGPPYVRRMWAGGLLVFNQNGNDQLHLDGARAACIERITDVSVKGAEGNEKIFVKIERSVGLVETSLCDSRSRENEKPRDDQQLLQHFYPAEENGLGHLPLVEVRNIVFMREKSPATAREDAARSGKILKPIHKPDFSVPITPTQSLLFRFSALTFNAHGIHLDPQYAREVEGHRNLLLHGPLLLVLMLSILRSQLKEGEMVKSFDYRNLAPLYANEELKVCVRKDKDKLDKYDVWVEGKGGGYAVKGTAIVAKTDT